MASLLKKNYALENLEGLYTCFRGDVDTIFRLSEAGQRYLVKDGSSISKGVEVLASVRVEINCVFFSSVGESETLPQKCRRNRKSRGK
jgi:hypothetical protein